MPISLQISFPYFGCVLINSGWPTSSGTCTTVWNPILQAIQITEQDKSWRSNAESSLCNITCCSNLFERDRRHICLLYCSTPRAVNCLTWLPVRQIQTFQYCGYFSRNGWTKVSDSKLWNIWTSVPYISAWFLEITRIIGNPKKTGMRIMSWCYVFVHTSIWYIFWSVVLMLTISMISRSH